MSQEELSQDYEEKFGEIFENITDLIEENKAREASALIKELHYADLADLLDNASGREQEKIIYLVEDFNPETLIWISSSNKQKIIEILGIEKSAQLISRLAPEDAVEVVEYLDQDLKGEILPMISAELRASVIEGLNYPEDSAGRILEKNFITLYSSWNVQRAMDHIKSMEHKDKFYSAIVIDGKSRSPVGSVNIIQLLQNPASTRISDLMNKDLKTATPLTELDDLVFIFKQYSLNIIPVVSKGGKILGVISLDSMFHVSNMEAEKDIMHLGGVFSQDFFSNMLSTAWHRFSWLFVNLIAAFLTAIIIKQFDATISQIVALAAIMPVVASMCASAGTQAMTVMVRAITNKDINHANMFRVIGKEIVVCGFNGLLLSLVGSGICFIITRDFGVSVIFMLSIILNFLIAGFLGAMIPITLHNLDLDPATASGVLLTAATDMLSFFIFLGMAFLFLV